MSATRGSRWQHKDSKQKSCTSPSAHSSPKRTLLPLPPLLLLCAFCCNTSKAVPLGALWCGRAEATVGGREDERREDRGGVGVGGVRVVRPPRRERARGEVSSSFVVALPAVSRCHTTDEKPTQRSASVVGWLVTPVLHPAQSRAPALPRHRRACVKSTTLPEGVAALLKALATRPQERQTGVFKRRTKHHAI